MALKTYRDRRDFQKSPEPSGQRNKSTGRSFVVQKHFASTLHYDFRLELGGTLKSWAVPKGPSLDPSVKRLAVQVEDHPVEYGKFQGDIPKGEYGAGKVLIWDQGEWEPQKPPTKGLKEGKLEFKLKGKRLKGNWVLVRSGTKEKSKSPNWLLIKRKDSWARSEDDFEVTKEETGSVLDEMLEDLPKTLEPQLAELAARPPRGKNWVHEFKWDGYRTMCRVEDGQVKFYSRNGHDWTDRYDVFNEDMLKLQIQSAWLDGEVVWMLPTGQQSFSLLQTSFKSKNKEGLIYLLFDLLILDGRDLRQKPLIQRKEILKGLLKDIGTARIKYSDHWETDGQDFFKAACKLKMEGIVSKVGTASYQAGRNPSWQKIKCHSTQEFVIGGYTLEKNTSGALGALLLGAYTSDGKFKYVGKVGTGFTASAAGVLLKKLKRIKTKESPFDLGPPEKGATWVKPKFIGQVQFAEITPQGVIRHASFQGLRDDKKASEVLLEQPKNTTTTDPKDSRRSRTKITHPNRVIYEELGYTKKDLFDYYNAVSEWIFPHLKGRPLALLRCPSGGECFFQKHLGSKIAGVKEISISSEEKEKSENVITLLSARGVLELCQLGVIEIHPWTSTIKMPDRPNLIVMDLDPGPEVGFSDLKDAAFELQELLAQLSLESFVKLTGGKGLHVHIPIRPQYGFEVIKPFARALAKKLVKDQPRKFTAQISKSKRRGKIFVDYLRNGFGATAICAYSARARPAASVAMPLTWKQLEKAESSDQFDIFEALKWIRKRKTDPWAEYDFKQRLILEGLAINTEKS